MDTQETVNSLHEKIGKNKQFKLIWKIQIGH